MYVGIYIYICTSVLTFYPIRRRKSRRGGAFLNYDERNRRHACTGYLPADIPVCLDNRRVCCTMADCDTVGKGKNRDSARRKRYARRLRRKNPQNARSGNKNHPVERIRSRASRRRVYNVPRRLHRSAKYLFVIHTRVVLRQRSPDSRFTYNIGYKE